MNRYETAVADRLHSAAGRIAVDPDARHVTESRRGPATPRSTSRRWTVVVGVAVAVAASAAAVLVAVRSTPDAAPSESVEIRPADGVGPSGDAPTVSPGSFAAHVASPPEWFGPPRAAQRTAGTRTGRWVGMAIGRVATDAVTAPIAVSVFDGSYAPLDDAEPVTIDGATFRSVRFEGWRALATGGTPTVMVSGSVDEGTLVAVLDAVEVTDPSGAFSVRLGVLPAGYAEVVAPRVLGPDPTPRRTLASASGDAGINEVSDWIDPLLYAASSGADLAAAVVDGDRGWTGLATGNPAGPLRFLVWSPRPGVLFEITTDDLERTERDVVDLALATSALEVDAWDDAYGG